MEVSCFQNQESLEWLNVKLIRINIHISRLQGSYTAIVFSISTPISCNFLRESRRKPRRPDDFPKARPFVGSLGASSDTRHFSPKDCPDFLQKKEPQNHPTQSTTRRPAEQIGSDRIGTLRRSEPAFPYNSATYAIRKPGKIGTDRGSIGNGKF